MSAVLVAMPTVEPSGDRKREALLRERLFTATRHLYEAIHAAGVFTDPFVPFKPVSAGDRLGDAFEQAERRYHSHWRSRVARLERQLKVALASDGLDDEQRRQIVAGIHNPHALRLSEVEQLLIEQYRSMSDYDRAAVRMIFKRFLQATQQDTSDTDGSGTSAARAEAHA